VLVNKDDVPAQVKMQVSNPNKGFIVSDRFEGIEEQNYTLKDIHEVSIPTGTSPQVQLDKVNKGTATDADHIYAITIGNKQTIESVTIKYSHLGISHKLTVSTRALQ